MVSCSALSVCMKKLIGEQIVCQKNNIIILFSTNFRKYHFVKVIMVQKTSTHTSGSERVKFTVSNLCTLLIILDKKTQCELAFVAL